MPELIEDAARGLDEADGPCKVCGGSGKVVWPPSAARPHLYHKEDAGWFSLVLCQDCGKLWVQAPYEPYASFIYLIAWPYTRTFWHSVVVLQDGLVLSRWCDYKIRLAWPTMSEHERLAVQNHQVRSYGRNPVDEAPGAFESDPLEPYLTSFEKDGFGG